MKGVGCSKCPVDEFECDAQYRGSRCAALRAKHGEDHDPDLDCETRPPIITYGVYWKMTEQPSGRHLLDWSLFSGWHTKFGTALKAYKEVKRNQNCAAARIVRREECFETEFEWHRKKDG